MQQQPKLIRVTTVPLSLAVLLKGQMRYMSEHGMEVIMISSAGKDWEDLLATETPKHYIINLAKRINIFRDLSAVFQLVKIIRKEKPDIVHSHTPKAGLVAMMAAYFGGCKIRLHTNSGTPLSTATGFKRTVFYFFEKLSYRFATKVFANSKSMEQYLINEKLIKRDKISVIGKGSSNGIDLGKFSKTALVNEKLELIKKQINYNPGFFYISIIGRIVKSKGILEMLEAFRNIQPQIPNIKLLVIGSFDDDFEPIEATEKEEILSSRNIIHVNWTNDVEYYLNLSGLLVHPSYREGFPNVLLQAGAMECPIVCSRIGGNVDVVTDMHTGLLVNVNDATDIEEKILYAYNNYEAVKVFAANLRQEIINNYDRKKVHEFILAEYNGLLKNGN